MPVAMIVEDDVIFQNYLKKILSQLNQFEDIVCFSEGKHAIRHTRSIGSELTFALVDIGLPDINGVDVIYQLRQINKDIKIIVVTVLEQKEILFASMKAGAFGYLLKDGTQAEITQRLQEALSGKAPISSAVARHIFEHVYSNADITFERFGLTARERELLNLISEGYNYSDIGKRMNLKITTVHAYSKSLFKKINVNSKYQAIVFYNNIVSNSI